MSRSACISVPIDIIRYVHQNKMHKALGVLLQMKSLCNGHMVLDKATQSIIMAGLAIRDVRCFNKHLERLKAENWVGFDVKKKVYYLRSFKELRKRYGFYNSAAVTFDLVKDSKEVTAFVQGAIVNHEILRRNKGRNVKIVKLAGRSALLKVGAIQELAAKGYISKYIGLSLSKLSEFLGTSQSQADRIKLKLKRLGYILVNAKYRVIAVSPSPDFNLVKFLPSKGRYSFAKRKKKGEVFYEVRERSFDELIPCMEFTYQRSIVKRLKVLEIGKV